MERNLDSSPKTVEIFAGGPDGAQGLRNQASACRRLASQAKTAAGKTSMTALADHFDGQARRLDLAEGKDCVKESSTPEDQPG